MSDVFDINSAASEDSGVFGLDFSSEDSKLILLPVPWEATTSYGGGTSSGPKAILQASHQVDLFDLDLGQFFKAGICMLPENKKISQWNAQAKKAGRSKNKNLKLVNKLGEEVNDYTYEQTKSWLEKDKIVGLVGGDHATPLGAIKAYTEKYPQMGILHFDAHADLRKAYEGFTYSHASIMYNVIETTKVKKLVQVGIRDFCQEEFDFINKNKNRIKTFYDQNLQEDKLCGKPWSEICEAIISELPEAVYISFDIDGLDPRLCPGTGTPVPGGLSFQEAIYLIKAVVQSQRIIVGFDLNEVAPQKNDGEWNANVGARLLFKLCGWALKPHT